MLSWMSRHEEHQGTADFIRLRFGELPNIEDVITELDAQIDSLEVSQNSDDKNEHSHLAYNRANLREALPIWFSEIHQNPAPAYGRFATTHRSERNTKSSSTLCGHKLLRLCGGQTSSCFVVTVCSQLMSVLVIYYWALHQKMQRLS
jgi:hypothetical protein